MLLPLALSFALLGAHQDSYLPHNTFLHGEEGWSMMQITGTGSKMAAVTDAAHSKNGSGSLKIDYKVGPGMTSGAVMPIEAGKLGTMNSIEFWVQDDHSTAILIALQEKGGGRYTATFPVSKGVWQKVSLSVSDFALSTDPDSPKDPDGKLDPDQVESVSITDFEMFLAQNAAIAAAVGIENGARTMYLADFKISADKLPANFVSDGTGYTFDTLSRPQSGWIGIGLNSFSLVSDSPFPGKWIKISYHAAPGRFAGVIKPLHAEALVGKSTISLKLGSTGPTKLLVQLEETGGGKYNTIIDVPGMARSTEISVPISSLMAAQDSKDADGKLDLDQVKQMILIDVSGIAAGVDADNTLWIGTVVAKA